VIWTFLKKIDFSLSESSLPAKKERGLDLSSGRSDALVKEASGLFAGGA